jgi:hypothetical protein
MEEKLPGVPTGNSEREGANIMREGTSTTKYNVVGHTCNLSTGEGR